MWHLPVLCSPPDRDHSLQILMSQKLLSPLIASRGQGSEPSPWCAPAPGLGTPPLPRRVSNFHGAGEGGGRPVLSTDAVIWVQLRLIFPQILTATARKRLF